MIVILWSDSVYTERSIQSFGFIVFSIIMFTVLNHILGDIPLYCSRKMISLSLYVLRGADNDNKITY